MARPPTPSVDQVNELPTLHRLVIPPEWKDSNGHLNIAYYMHLYNDAAIPLFDLWGAQRVPGFQDSWGIFDLEHHVWYWREVHVGDEVTLHFRLIGNNAKRFHGTLLLVNRTRDEVASALEFVSTGADLHLRATSVLPPEIVQSLDAMRVAHHKLPWICPTSGSMRI